MKKVYSKEERAEQAVKIGLGFAKTQGLSRVSLGSVATKMEVTAPLLFHVFGNRDGFHAALKKEAKKQGLTFPAAEPTVRAARAERVAKLTAPKAKPVVKAPKAKPVVKAPKAKPVVKAPKAKPVVKAPKAKPVVAAKAKPKFPTLPVPAVVEPVAAA